MAVDKEWLEKTVRAVRAMEAIYGPHQRVDCDVGKNSNAYSPVIVYWGIAWVDPVLRCLTHDPLGNWVEALRIALAAPQVKSDVPPAKPPAMLWHADGEGRCHRGCEQWSIDEHGHDGCKLLDLVAWEVFQQPTTGDVGCPFAVLAGAFGLHRSEPLPDDSHKCPTCVYAETMECGGGLVDRGPMHCWKPKPARERRCGTCVNQQRRSDTCGGCKTEKPFTSTCAVLGRHGRCGHTETWEDGEFGDNGPPWPDCRFWKERT